MLEPDVRELLLDALRPPDDCELVHAVGTTYSLDLQALLFAPLAFAMFDWALDDDGVPNPLALLESLRRYADRTTVFCQAGEIGVPPPKQPLLTYLEPCVVPVTPPDPHWIFHPKLWVLRFRPKDGDRDRYRLLCLTRNLTFDTAWDTACVLDGQPKRRGSDTLRQNAPLVAFLRALEQRTNTLNDGRRQALRDLADDIADVRFIPPDGFESVEFHPLGLADGGWPLPPQPRRTFVVSPFLTAGALGRLRGTEGTDVLISRQEMLDALGAKGLHGYETFAFSEATSRLDEADGDDAGAPTPLIDEMRGDAIDAELHGLHAKLTVAEYDGQVRFFTGSANATDAAFDGNVEFLVELCPRKDSVDIASLLAQPKGITAFRDLIEPYRPAHDDPPEEGDAHAVARILDVARRTLGALPFVATLQEREDGSYQLDLRADAPVQLPEEVTEITCWPISRGHGHAVTFTLDANGLSAAFGAVAQEGITSFFGIALRATRGTASDEVRFVVNAELVGAPEGRAEQVITQVLTNRQDVLRYLLFLLADTSGGQAGLAELLGGEGASGGEWGLDGDGMPLFETLMRTLAREPERLDHVAKLLDDLRDGDHAADLIPPELDAVWAPIWAARQELDA